MMNRHATCARLARGLREACARLAQYDIAMIIIVGVVLFVSVIKILQVVACAVTVGVVVGVVV